MVEKRSRYVLACQQAFVLATVAAVGLSAGGVVELEFVAPGDSAPAGSRPVAGSAPGTAAVSSAPVVPHVRTVPLGGAESSGMRAPGARARGPQRAVVTSAPEAARGFATVGITWDPGQDVAEDALRVSVRTLADGAWSSWQEVPYDPDHEPDPDAQGAEVREGTDAVVVGDVDDVQVRVTSATGRTPDGLELAIVDTCADVAPTVERPDIDTGRLAAATLVGSPADVTPQPRIFSRAQWGADERLRDPGSLRYGEVHAGFVHHTVNANSYTRSDVPAILRGIYAYHTQSRGWSDVGYNFLVDRFGRIWEGRYGGVDRPVVGAHTLGYNDDAFAMSAIGNFETAQPSQRMLNAYARLFAWKLSLHGVRADDSRQRVSGSWLPAINGHRDVGQTACPGRYLYAKIPEIRSAAAALQRPWSSRDPVGQVSGSAWPDLVMRDPRNNHAVYVRTGGQLSFAPGVSAATGWQDVTLAAAPGDVDEDGTADVVAGNGNGVALYRGAAAGNVGAAGRTYPAFAGLDLLTGVGDFDGDGHVDLVGRHARTHALLLFRGRGDGTFRAAVQLASDYGAYETVLGAGDVDGDGRADLLARDGSTLYLVPGAGTGLRRATALPGSWNGFDVLAGQGDLTRDGRPDLVARDAATKKTYIYPGDGQGGFTRRLGPFPRLSGLRWIAIAGQMTGTRQPDLVGIGTRGVLRVVPHTGRYNLGRVIDTGVALNRVDLLVNVGDWNGDGRGDLMTRDSSTGSMTFWAGRRRNQLAEPVPAAVGWGNVGLVTAVGDMTGDGHPDLVGRYAGSWRVYPGDGDRGFQRSYVIHSDFPANRMAGVGRWDADGTPDVVVRHGDGALWAWSSNGPGGLTGSQQVGGGTRRFDWVRGLGDLDGNGRGDLIVRARKSGAMFIIPARKNGFGPPRYLGASFGGYDLLG